MIWTAIRVSAESNVVFQKTLPDGRQITVEKSASEGLRLGTNINQTGPIVEGVGGKVRSTRYVCYVRVGGTNLNVWEKTIAASFDGEVGYAWSRPKIFDVEIRGKTAAVLFSDDKVYVEKTEIGGNLMPISSVIVCNQSSLQSLVSGRLNWLENLYVVGELQTDKLSPVFYRITATGVEHLFPASDSKKL